MELAIFFPRYEDIPEVAERYAYNYFTHLHRHGPCARSRQAA